MGVRSRQSTSMSPSSTFRGLHDFLVKASLVVGFIASISLTNDGTTTWLFEPTRGIGVAEAYTFALCPKSVDNPFFHAARAGCEDRARFLSQQLQDVIFEGEATASTTRSEVANNISSQNDKANPSVECLFVGPTGADDVEGLLQAEAIRALIDEGTIDGLAISVANPEVIRPVIQEALDRGISVVTFDSDDEGSGRATYIGTDNFFFGQQLGKVVKQLLPTGGTFAILTDASPNIIDRERGVRQEMDLRQQNKGEWFEVSASPLDMKGNSTLAIELMRDLAERMGSNLTAIVPTMGAPMFLPELWSALVNDFPEILFVVADGLPVQLDFLSRNKVAGLVAQLPYEMGVLSMDTLMALALEKEDSDQVLEGSPTNAPREISFGAKTYTIPFPNFLGTNVLQHLRIPLVLPELKVDENYFGSLSTLGFVLYAMVFCSATGLIFWTYLNRNIRVVQCAQPSILCLIAIGIMVLGAAMLPLGFDDSSPSYTARKGTIICMSPIWCVFLGFTMTFSAVFAKLWRVNRLFRASENFLRIKVTTMDVLKPLIILMTINLITLLTWTLVDPLRYERQASEGTDAWNRVISTYGTCVADAPWPYVSILLVLNVGVLLVANAQAYMARGIKSEFSEAKYFAMAVLCMLQACLSGVPLLFVVKNFPQAWYLTLVFIIFIICIVVLLLIFIPKVLSAHEQKKRSEGSQKGHIGGLVHASTNIHSKNWANSQQISGLQSESDMVSNKSQSEAFQGVH